MNKSYQQYLNRYSLNLIELFNEMNCEAKRLESFNHWDQRELSELLARFGYFACVFSNDDVRCFFCDIQLSVSEISDVSKDHKYNCKLICGIPTNNIPINEFKFNYCIIKSLNSLKTINLETIKTRVKKFCSGPNENEVVYSISQIKFEPVFKQDKHYEPRDFESEFV